MKGGVVGIKFTGLEAAITKMKRLKSRIQPSSDLTMKELAQNFKKMVVTRINANRRFNSRGANHNTPQPLQSHLHYRKNNQGNYDVFFDAQGENLAWWVEAGTGSHPIKNPYFPSGKHPGANAKNFWLHSVNEIKTQVPVKLDALNRDVFR